MDNNSSNSGSEPTKVVSLFATRKTQDVSTEEMTAKEAKESNKKESEFLQEMRRNMENAERMKKERLKANQNVLKSYRIKN